MPKEFRNNVKNIKKNENNIKKGKATKIENVVTESKNLKKSKKVYNKAITNTLKSKNNPKNVTKIEKKVNTNTKKPEFLQEYYDLPYRYNETIVTILAQTPKRLFVYWDVSDKDKETYKKAFGDDFFDKTYPVLLVHNEELNYTFEVPINDFANSWYLDIKDSKKNYVVQLGRKFKNIEQLKEVNFEVVKDENINLKNDFVYITDSNKLEIPNDHILFETLPNKVKYRNVKNGNEFTKEVKDLVNDFNGVYPEEMANKLYTKLYENEIANENFARTNPSSSGVEMPTSSGAFRL